MQIKPWRHTSQHDDEITTRSRTGRIERNIAVQWKHRIFAAVTQNVDLQRPRQLLPIGAQDMPELRVLVQPMFQQHYIYFMTHRYFNENLGAPSDVDVWEILTKFTNRYTNPNASEIELLVNF